MASYWLVICAASTWFMTGLIWFVQVVHYPLFGRVGAREFPEYHAEHTRRTTRVVIGPMGLQLASSLALVARPPRGADPSLTWIGLGLAIACWASTGLVQVPLHGRLAGGLDMTIVERLVRSNRVRTAAWSGHAAILVIMLATCLENSGPMPR